MIVLEVDLDMPSGDGVVAEPLEAFRLARLILIRVMMFLFQVVASRGAVTDSHSRTE